MLQVSKEIIDTLLIVGALQGIVICVPLFRYRNNRAPNRILIALILLCAADCTSINSLVYSRT